MAFGNFAGRDVKRPYQNGPTMANENIKTAVMEFIASDLLLDAEPIEEHTSLFQSRMIDSMNLVQLLNFLETEFALKIPTADVNVDNLDTVQAIEGLIRKIKSRS